MKKAPAYPTRLVDLPDEQAPGEVAVLIRSAVTAPAADTPRVKWRIRSTLRSRVERRGRWLRFALVGSCMFVMGGVVGAAVRPFLRGHGPVVGPHPAPERAAHDGRWPRKVARLAAGGPPPVTSPEAERAAVAAARPATSEASAMDRAASPGSSADRSSTHAEHSRPRSSAMTASRVAATGPAPVLRAPGASVEPPLAPAASPLPTPPPPTVTAPAAPSASEQALIATTLDKLRTSHEPKAALAALDEYRRQFPNGVLTPEAARLRIEALLLLGRKAAALDELDRAAPAETGTSDERLVLRGELRAAAGRWREALADFDVVVRAYSTSSTNPDDQRSCDRLERALWGRASASSRLGDERAAREDLSEYLRRFPDGRFARQANRLLEGRRAP